MRRFLRTGLFAFLLTAPLALSAGDAPAPEAEALQKAVFDAYRAGIVKHDLQAYFAVFADDAAVTTGRTEKPDRHDVVLDRRRLEAVRRMMYGAPAYGYGLNLEPMGAKVEGDRAEIRYRATFRIGRDLLQQVEECMRLRRTPDGWRIAEGRSWPVYKKSGAEAVVYGADAWKELDDKVEQARAKPWPALPYALFEACRFAEAFDEARKKTEQAGATAQDWIARGMAAVPAGDAEDARRSFDKALELDPNAPVPPWGRKEAVK